MPHTDELLVEVSRPPGGASNVYKLSIETSLPQYKRTSFGSQATLADLDSLYATLDRAYPRLLVPLPPSRLLGIRNARGGGVIASGSVDEVNLACFSMPSPPPLFLSYFGCVRFSFGLLVASGPWAVQR